MKNLNLPKIKTKRAREPSNQACLILYYMLKQRRLEEKIWFSPKELSIGTNLNQTGIYSIIQSLVDKGYLKQEKKDVEFGRSLYVFSLVDPKNSDFVVFYRTERSAKFRSLLGIKSSLLLLFSLLRIF